MKDETEYYDWDNIPCVFIEDSDGGLFGFYMPGEHTSWIKADAMVYLECRFKARAKLTKNEFERFFGVIGKDLPPLPESW
jgi:hypothetical protein